jgi:ATP-binding cassette subfamily G (WHITE) protein 2 (PDR)
VIGAAPGSETTIDWPEVWNNSDERLAIKATLAEMKADLSQIPVETDKTALYQFAAPFFLQLKTVVMRVFQQYWRTPSYLYSKTALCTCVVSLFHTSLP